MERKARFEMRLDRESHKRAKLMAAAAGVSMNELLEGILCWAIPRTNPGRPVHRPDGRIESRAEERILWVSDRDDGAAEDDGVSFVLDYTTPRCVVPGESGVMDSQRYDEMEAEDGGIE